MASITMKQMLEAGIHFGHQTRRWNPKMARYIFGERHGIYIIDLQKTLRQLQKAYKAVRDVSAQGGKVLFVGTKKQARDVVKDEAERCGMYYINNRWLGGTMTNWVTIQQSINKMIHLEELVSSGKIEKYTKKEAIDMNKLHEKLEKNLGGIKEMDGVPSLVFIVDSHREKIAIAEASRLGIPCVSICDTNADPDAVTIPIPGNDDAIRSVSLFCSIMADAVLDGRAQFEKELAERTAKEQAAAKSAKLAKGQQKDADEEPVETMADAEESADAPEADAATEEVVAAAETEA